MRGRKGCAGDFIEHRLPVSDGSQGKHYNAMMNLGVVWRNAGRVKISIGDLRKHLNNLCLTRACVYKHLQKVCLRFVLKNVGVG